MSFILNPLQLCRMPSIISINIEIFSGHVAFIHCSTFLVNICLPISFKWFMHSVPPMDSVCLSLNWNISKLLRSPIEDQVIMKPLVKCYWLTNVWTNLQQHELISRGMECWMTHACCIHIGWCTSLVSLIHISIHTILTNLSYSWDWSRYWWIGWRGWDWRWRGQKWQWWWWGGWEQWRWWWRKQQWVHVGAYRCLPSKDNMYLLLWTWNHLLSELVLIYMII